MIHLRIETIIIVLVKNKTMKIIIRVFAEKNVKDSGEYKLIKEPVKLLHWLILNLCSTLYH